MGALIYREMHEQALARARMFHRPHSCMRFGLEPYRYFWERLPQQKEAQQ